MPLIRTGGGRIDSIDDARRLAAELIDQEQRAAFRSGRADDLLCRAGCTARCGHAVPVGPAELRAMVAAIEDLDGDARARTRRRITERDGALRERGFSALDLQDQDGDERKAVSHRYFGAGFKCPLLDGDTCVVREARPLICRDYLVTSDPKECETISNEKAVRVRLGRTIVGSFAGLQRHIEDHESLILALALDEKIPASAPMPAMSPSAGVRRLTSPEPAGASAWVDRIEVAAADQQPLSEGSPNHGRTQRHPTRDNLPGRHS